jgi:hypothetical protein
VAFEVSLSYTVNIKKRTNLAANVLSYLPSLSTELLSESARSVLVNAFAQKNPQYFRSLSDSHAFL